MSTPTLTNVVGESTENLSGRHERPDARDAHRALWAMTRDERIAAMWRRELLGGEFAWIAMRTPEWAEITNEAGVDPEEVDP